MQKLTLPLQGMMKIPDMTTKDISLSSVSAGRAVKIARIDAGRSLRHRLAALGLLPGASVKVLQTLGRGQLVIEVFQSKTLLGRGVTDKIYVTES
jgi:ferrous iron transport protein A